MGLKTKVFFASSVALLTMISSSVTAQNAAETKPAGIKIPTLDELAKNPKFSSFTVSPNGKYFAAIEKNGEKTQILVWETDNLSKAPNVIGTAVMKFTYVSFIKDGVLVVGAYQPFDYRFDSVIKTFIGKTLITDINGSKWLDPLPLPTPKSNTDAIEQAGSSASILDSLVNDPDHVLMVNNYGVDSGDIYKVNIRNGKAEKIQRATEKTAGYQTDLEGNIRARSRGDVDSTGAYFALEFKNDKGEWEEHLRTYSKDREQGSIIGFSKDPNIAYLATNRGRDKIGIYEYNIKEKKIGSEIFAHTFFDAIGVRQERLHGPNFGAILGFEYAGPREAEEIVDKEQIELDLIIRKALKIEKDKIKFVDPDTGNYANTEFDVDNYYDIVARSYDRNVIIIEVAGPKQPPVYYLLKNKKQLMLLGRARPEIDSKSLGTEELVYYKARDGLDIPAFLHKPNPEIYGKGPYPTIIHPHGGPWARDHMDWDWSNWTQLLTSRGYAVLQPQYRATADGWGKKLWLAGDKEWGGKMQDDKDDGANWLVSQGIADKNKIAMFGFSYGGYASMVASIRPNGIYKCAIAGAGVSNIDTIWAKFYQNPYFREAQAPTVKGMSPELFVDKISIPILVYHGERDQTVPIEQSLKFVNKAKKLGKPIKYLQIADYAHGPAWTEGVRKTELTAIEDFLNNDCGFGKK